MRKANDEHQGTILIVEDERELRFILKAHLHAVGFQVIEARDGATGIRMAKEQRPDLIIMDIGLPVLDGLAATRALKGDKSTAGIPIIILTGRTSKQEIVEGLEAGAQEYLPKPFDVAELLARVQNVHRLARARQELDHLNTELEAEVDLKTHRLQRLYEFTRDLNHARSRDEILDLIVSCVRDTMGAGRISLFLADSAGAYLICERAVGMDVGEIKPIPISRIEGITGKVFHSGKTLSARTYGNGSEDDDSYFSNDFCSAPLVVTSLETQEGRIGVLNVTEKADNAPFTDGEIECIRSIAQTGAMALEDTIRRTRLQRSVDILLQTLGLLAEYRDDETTRHLERVSQMVSVLARSLQKGGPYASIITAEYIEMLVQAAPMHDIGKVGIPDEILTKPGKLTDEEYQIMKSHTEIGRRVLSKALDPDLPIPLLKMCVDIAHSHHERYDGDGYPRRLKGSDIPLCARIVGLVDAYDAITSRRRYKLERSHEEAVEVLRTESGRHFDPVLVEAFLDCHAQFEVLGQTHTDHLETVGADQL